MARRLAPESAQATPRGRRTSSSSLAPCAAPGSGATTATCRRLALRAVVFFTALFGRPAALAGPGALAGPVAAPPACPTAPSPGCTCAPLPGRRIPCPPPSPPPFFPAPHATLTRSGTPTSAPRSPSCPASFPASSPSATGPAGPKDTADPLPRTPLASRHGARRVERTRPSPPSRHLGLASSQPSGPCPCLCAKSSSSPSATGPGAPVLAEPLFLDARVPLSPLRGEGDPAAPPRPNTRGGADTLGSPAGPGMPGCGEGVPRGSAASLAGSLDKPPPSPAPSRGPGVSASPAPSPSAPTRGGVGPGASPGTLRMSGMSETPPVVRTTGSGPSGGGVSAAMLAAPTATPPPPPAPLPWLPTLSAVSRPLPTNSRAPSASPAPPPPLPQYHPPQPPAPPPGQPA